MKHGFIFGALLLTGAAVQAQACGTPEAAGKACYLPGGGGGDVVFWKPDQKSSGYTLITVTYGGEVGHSRGYQTVRMCEQAKSIALTGMTIEQNEAADAEYAESEKKRAETRKAPQKNSAVSRGTSGIAVHGPGYYPNNGEDVRYVRGGWVLKYRTDVKHAECVSEVKTK